MKRNRSTRVVKSVNHPDIIEMAKYVYKRRNNTKEVKDYSEQINSLDKQKDRNFNNKHRYSYKFESIDSIDIDNFADNEIKLLTEPQYLDRQKHFLSTQGPNTRPEYVFESKPSKQPTFDVRKYNMLQKSNTRDLKTSRKRFKFELPTKQVFTTKDLKLPQIYGKSSAKLKDNIIRNDYNVPESDAVSKSNNIIMNVANIGNKYLRQYQNLSTENPFADNYTYNVPELAQYVFSQIPRIGSDLNVIDPHFSLSSKEYRFVSSFVNIESHLIQCLHVGRNEVFEVAYL